METLDKVFLLIGVIVFLFVFYKVVNNPNVSFNDDLGESNSSRLFKLPEPTPPLFTTYTYLPNLTSGVEMPKVDPPKKIKFTGKKRAKAYRNARQKIRRRYR